MTVRTKLFLAAFLIVSGAAIILTHSRIASAVTGPVCGNLVIEDDEQCDDGNTNSGDGCSITCQIEIPPSVCGNSAVEAGETCDDGNIITEDCNYGETSCTVCDETCQSVPGYTSYCGDGALSDEEQCDDGNAVPGDGCSATCTTESSTPPVCGNAIVETGEACDDGNIIPGDGCSCYCQTERCGDSKQDANEQCDDGNAVSGDGCSATCGAEKCPKGSKTCIEKKITICHIPPGNKPNIQIISVGISSLKAHLDHGDTLGDCSNTCR